MNSSPLAQLMSQRVGPAFDFGGYRFSRAESEAESLDAFRLRHKVFVGEGFLDPSQFADGFFRDQFDQVSTHILVRDGAGGLVATTRFVHSTSMGFPTEHLFDFAPPGVPRARLGEYGRLAIEPAHRGGARAPMLGLLKAVFECMIEQRTTHVFAFLSPKLAQSYAALGCVSVPLETRPPSAETVSRRQPMRGYFENQQVHPVLFDLREMMIQVGVPFDRDELAFVEERMPSRRGLGGESPPRLAVVSPG